MADDYSADSSTTGRIEIGGTLLGTNDGYGDVHIEGFKALWGIE